MNDYAQHQYLQQQQQLYQQDQQQMYCQQQDQHQQQYDNMMMQQHHHQQQQQQHQYGSSAEDYAHYPYPDEYLNERNSQYLMENTYGQQQECKLYEHFQHDYRTFSDLYLHSFSF